MKFKVKEIKNEIVTSFLTISLLVSPILNLKANERKDDFIVHFPEPSKIQTIKVDSIEEKDFVARYYAHDGSYVIINDLIFFKKFTNEATFYKKFDEKSDLISTAFLNVKTGNDEFAIIFTLFKDSTLKYYVFTKDPTFTYVVKVNINKFKVSENTKLEVDFYQEEMEYLLKIKCESVPTKYYRSDLLLNDEE